MTMPSLHKQASRPSETDRLLDDIGQYGPVAKTLTQLIRTAFVAAEGKTFVWGDWSNIEARINPWLAISVEGDRKLDLFRLSDASPKLPDIYVQTASDLLGLGPREITKEQRQSHGKVPELALGFGGGIGALQAMATTYGVYMDDEMAQDMVRRWRAVNPWAEIFWNRLWDAAMRAYQLPWTECPAGRVSYLFDPEYLGGSLFCALPCGRFLTYPQFRQELREVENKDGTKEIKLQWTYRKGHGRAAAWRGKLCENVVQATAGSLLRAKLLRLECEALLTTVAHTHDEIVVECLESSEPTALAYLAEVMTDPEPWSKGLPLKADVKSKWWLSKADD